MGGRSHEAEEERCNDINREMRALSWRLFRAIAQGLEACMTTTRSRLLRATVSHYPRHPSYSGISPAGNSGVSCREVTGTYRGGLYSGSCGSLVAVAPAFAHCVRLTGSRLNHSELLPPQSATTDIRNFIRGLRSSLAFHAVEEPAIYLQLFPSLTPPREAAIGHAQHRFAPACSRRRPRSKLVSVCSLIHYSNAR